MFALNFNIVLIVNRDQDRNQSDVSVSAYFWNRKPNGGFSILFLKLE